MYWTSPTITSLVLTKVYSTQSHTVVGLIVGVTLGVGVFVGVSVIVGVGVGLSVTVKVGV
jgi:hypothetical protein